MSADDLQPPPIRDQNQNSLVWQSWYREIQRMLSEGGMPWAIINKAGSSLADLATRLFTDLQFTGSNITSIETRNHADLQNILGSGAHHFSELEHTDLTDAGTSALHYHDADRARANHTGTQLAATISDFDSAADARVAVHVGLADPHTQYQKESEKDSASGYAGLDASSRTTKGVDTTDDLIVDLATKGLVLKDTQGTPHYWRVTISILGVLTTTDLGTTKP